MRIDEVYAKPVRPEKVLCFGEGNFLRAFAAAVVQKLDDNAGFDGGIVMLQGVERGNAALINSQNGMYTVVERGSDDGRATENFMRVDCVSRCIDPYSDYEAYMSVADSADLRFIVSNTTEFGICYDDGEKVGGTHRNFPAKLTDFLYRRYRHFKGALDKGPVILPCELIEHNGRTLKTYVTRYAAAWRLESGFTEWLEKAVVFADTLVDRIVSGYPADAGEICGKLGYEDRLLDVCEPFFLWVIESDDERVKNIPFASCGLDVVITDNLEPYRTRKVRILNGAHTMSVAAALMCGLDTVEHMIKDETFNAYVRKGLGEVIPTFEGEDLYEYADSVTERFRNPYLNHRLASIALNSISKFRARVLPSIVGYAERFGEAPDVLSFSLAALYFFYLKGGENVRDEKKFTDETASCRDISDFLSRAALWGSDLTQVKGLKEKAEKSYGDIATFGMRAAVGKVTYGK